MLSGSLQEKSGKYYAVFRINGKQKWINLQIPAEDINRELAQTMMNKVIAEVYSYGSSKISPLNKDDTDYNKLLYHYDDILTAEDLVNILPIGRTSIYSLIKSNVIPNVRVGNRVFILKTSLIEYLENMRGKSFLKKSQVAARRIYLDNCTKNVSFDKYLDIWLREVRPVVKPLTWGSYDKIVRGKINPYFETQKRKLKDLQPKDFIDYFEYLKTSGKTSGEGGLSERSIKNIRGVLSAALSCAKENSLIDKNIVLLPTVKAFFYNDSTKNVDRTQSDEIDFEQYFYELTGEKLL